MRLFFCALFAIGCGSSQPAPAAPTAAAKGAPKPTRPGKSAVFFVVDYEALLPVACFDAHKNEWKNGEPCYELLPDDASVALEGGKSIKVGGWRVPTITNCTLSTPLLMFEGAASEKPGTFAVWPEGRKIERVDWESTKGASSLDAAGKDGLIRAMGKLSSPPSISVVQVVQHDLGDGPAKIISATTGGFDPASGKGMGALFVARGSEEPTPIRNSDHAVFRVEGLLDLDDDGLPEIWASERTFHPNGRKSDAMTVARWTAGGLAPLTPLESCWPPAKI